MTDAPCSQCAGQGWERALDGGPDACGRCARRAEFQWVSGSSGAGLRAKGKVMNSREQTGPNGAGTVTAACVWIAGEPTFELIVYPALLRALPWYRGGRNVAVIHGVAAGGGELTITTPGPYRLLAKAENRFDKFPPVLLRVARLDHLRPAEHAAEPLTYTIRPDALRLTLPEWARPPVPLTAPVTSFGSVLGGEVR